MIVIVFLIGYLSIDVIAKQHPTSFYFTKFIEEIDDYLDISIGDDEDIIANNSQKKTEEKPMNKFNLSALKQERIEIVLNNK